MKTLLKLVLFACAAAAFTQAQNYTSVVGSNISDAAGNKLAAGNMCFVATDASNQPTNFQVGGGGTVVRTPVCFSVTNGAIAPGAQVANPATTVPAGILYKIAITDTNLKQTVVSYSMVSFSGATFNFDLYSQPDAAVLPPSGGSIAGPLVVNGDLSVTGTLHWSGAGATAIVGNPTGPQSIAGDFPLSVGGSFTAKRINGLRFPDQFSSNAQAVTDCAAGPCVLFSTPANANTDLFSPLASSNFLFALQKPRYFPGLFVGDLPPSTGAPTGYPSQLGYSQTGIQLDYCVFCIGRQMNLGATTINNVDSTEFHYYVLSGNPTAGTGSKQIVGWENVIDTGNSANDLANVATLKATEYVVNQYSPSFVGTLLGPEFDCNHMSNSTLAGMVCNAIVFGANDATKTAGIPGTVYGSTSTANLRTNGALGRMVSYQAGWQNFLGASGSVTGYTGFACCQTSGTSTTAWGDNVYQYISAKPNAFPTFSAGHTLFAYVIDGLGASSNNLMNFWMTGGDWNSGHFTFGSNGQSSADHLWWSGGFRAKFGAAPSSSGDYNWAISSTSPVSLGAASSVYRWDSAGAAGNEVRAMNAANGVGGISVSSILNVGTNPVSLGNVSSVFRWDSGGAVGFEMRALNTSNGIDGITVSGISNAGSATVGGGSTINAEYKGSGTLTYTAITAPACQEQPLTINSAAASDACYASTGSTDIGIAFYYGGCRISASGIAQIKVCATSTGTPTATTWTGWARH